jgi:hypothetical protein
VAYVFVGCLYRSKKNDRFWEKAPHHRQRRKEAQRRADASPAGVRRRGSAEEPHTMTIGARQGMIVLDLDREGDPTSAPIGGTQIVRADALDRIKCPRCDNASEVPRFAPLPPPGLPGQ